MAQLYLFEQSPEDKLRMEFDDVKRSCDKVRKGQFARIGEISKVVISLQQKIEHLEHQMMVWSQCK